MAKHVDINQAKQIANAVIAKVRNKGYAVKGEIVYADLAAALQAVIDAKAAQSDLTTVSGKVDTLVGSDTGKSVRTVSAEEVAKVVAGASESFDTLKEIADWIENDTTGAAKMANDIADLITKTELGTYEEGGQQVEYDTVKDYVEGYVAEQISDAGLSGSNAISIASKVVSLIIDSTNANGLTITQNGLALSAATQSAAGAMSAEDKLKLDNADVTAYTAGNGVNVTNHVISAVVDTANANGLSVGANGLAMSAATASTSGVGGSNGAMLATDKEKLDSIEFATAADITALINSLDSLDPVTP